MKRRSINITGMERIAKSQLGTGVEANKRDNTRLKKHKIVVHQPTKYEMPANTKAIIAPAITLLQTGSCQVFLNIDSELAITHLFSSLDSHVDISWEKS